MWSRTLDVDGNIARQLIVPSTTLDTVSGEVGALQLRNKHGVWPASTADRPLDSQRLWAGLPIGTQPGARVPPSTSWSRPTDLEATSPSQVLSSYVGAIGFEPGTHERPGLRAPQLGAMHAVLGYWTTRRLEPATVAMPTGTGKTETMLGLLLAARPERLLVLVPSGALRNQIAAKFDRLGVLHELELRRQRHCAQ